jgi:hypothetical protein
LTPPLRAAYFATQNARIGSPYAQSAAAAVIAGTLTLLSAGSAAGTLLLALMSEDRELLDASGDVAEVGLSEGEARELQGRS